MLKEHGKKKPLKKVKKIRCKNCEWVFESIEENKERIKGKDVYICPKCGYEIKK